MSNIISRSYKSTYKLTTVVKHGGQPLEFKKWLQQGLEQGFHIDVDRAFHQETVLTDNVIAATSGEADNDHQAPE